MQIIGRNSLFNMAFNELLKLAVNHPIFMLDRFRIRTIELPLEDFLSIFSLSPDNIANKKEIRIHGLRRTGNHALINWIEKQSDGVTVHLNNLRPEENPYKNYWRVLSGKVHPRERWRVSELKYNDCYKGDSGHAIVKKESQGKFLKKDCLILSYEDHHITRVSSARAMRTHDRYVGKSRCRFDLLILRDPFNLIASRVRSNMLDVRGIGKNLTDLWIDHAKEYLNETNYLRYEKVIVNYNRWFLERSYREKIALRLKLSFSDTGINDVPGFGAGSSFDSTGLDGRAQDMNVLNRWRQYEDHGLYRSLVNNDELIYYSRKIFGHIPGTERLLD